MTIYLVVLAVVFVVSIFLCMWGEGDSGPQFIGQIVGVFGCIAGLIGSVGIGIMSIEWVGSSHKAQIINREYGTNYTQAEIFYASSVIDTIRELDRRRYEVNGDFRRAQPDPTVQARREKVK